MSASQQRAVSTAPEFDGILRKRLEAVPIKDLAADTRIDASHLSKFILGHAALKLDDVSKLVKRVDLKTVDVNRVCIRREELAFLRRVHAIVIEHAQWLLDEAEA